MNRNYFLFIFILVLLACNTEKKYAKLFLHEKDSVSLMIMKPDVVFKTNYKSNEITYFDSLTSSVQDSLLYARSSFIQYFSDTEIIKCYYTSLVQGLNDYDLKPYGTDNFGTFFEQKTKAFIFQIAQMQIEEYKIPFEESAVFGEEEHTVNFDLNAVNFNIWYEVSQLNADSGLMTILYNQQNIQDKISGHFKKYFLSEDVRYDYNRKDVSVTNVFELAAKTGKLHAQYIFDYLMNRALFERLKQKPKFYYHYDPRKKRISKAKDNRFIFL